MGALSVVPKNMLTAYPQVWDLSPRASKLSVETLGAILGGPSRTPVAIGLKTWWHRRSGAYPNRLSGLRPIDHLFNALAAGVSSDYQSDIPVCRVADIPVCRF
jgi:hypothetical protein